MFQVHCEVCRCIINSDTDIIVCDKYDCQRTFKIRKDLRERIAVYVNHFHGRIPDEYTYREYLEKAGLEERYQKFAGVYYDNSKEPKCSRRVWFQMNIGLNHQLWPDESGRLKNAA